MVHAKAQRRKGIVRDGASALGATFQTTFANFAFLAFLAALRYGSSSPRRRDATDDDTQRRRDAKG
ncbi:hypothetical protein A6A03_01560 [Chloroflexus islandicus]|uniref:Uncharacterized protein n=1 Tax=Chloroflexus islandicus TaxID=1707952 RepID=A0A178MBN1_9CHLR|nr:hypothetical protein A6A03_01560 [Chloroflexus islandicus]